MRRVAILDVDGTLVDTNYQHARAWYLAFRDHDIVLPIWRIHRHVGMGGDQMVEALTDSETEKRLGDRIRSSQSERYGEMIDEVAALEGATELLQTLKDAGHAVVLASSAKEDEIERYLELLCAREVVDGWTSSGDVEETKPAPDLVSAALKIVDADAAEATMVGDSIWDAESAQRAGVETVAVMTGGFSADELREAGAVVVYESIAELSEHLEDGSERRRG